MTTRRFDVVRSGSEWTVKTTGGPTMPHFFTREAAIRLGQDVAKASGPSELVVHRRDGSVECTRTYGAPPRTDVCRCAE